MHFPLCVIVVSLTGYSCHTLQTSFATEPAMQRMCCSSPVTRWLAPAQLHGVKFTLVMVGGEEQLPSGCHWLASSSDHQPTQVPGCRHPVNCRDDQTHIVSTCKSGAPLVRHNSAATTSQQPAQPITLLPSTRSGDGCCDRPKAQEPQQPAPPRPRKLKCRASGHLVPLSVC